MAAEREFVYGGTFASKVKDANLTGNSGSKGWEVGKRHTFESGTPRLYRDLGYGLFLQ